MRKREEGPHSARELLKINKPSALSLGGNKKKERKEKKKKKKKREKKEKKKNTTSIFGEGERHFLGGGRDLPYFGPSPWRQTGFGNLLPFQQQRNTGIPIEDLRNFRQGGKSPYPNF